MTNRRLETIIAATEKVCDVMGWPINLNADNEFNKQAFNDVMAKHNVRLWYSDPDEINKNAIVERFNMTLALLLQRWHISSHRYDWQKILPSIVKNYNNTFHRTVRVTPQDIWDGKVQRTDHHQTAAAVESW